eukprot:EG_transcript_22739
MKSRRALSLEVPEAPLRLHAENLEEMLKGEKALVVIDVRGEDYQGGHITGSINCPYDEFPANLDSLVEAHGKAEQVVFYCMNSQVRSPSCASLFMAKVKETFPDSNQEVFVLIGGFLQWVRPRSGNPELVVDFDEKLWTAIWEATDAGAC